MERVVFLGTASAVSNEDHENSHLLVQIDERVILIDCVGNPVVRLKQAGVHPHQITDVILTHFHPDHVSSFPLLLMDMWLMGRTTRLKVYGLDHTIERVKKMMDLYDWDRWPDFFEVDFQNLPEKTKHRVFDDGTIRLITSPVRHLLPTVATRFEFIKSKKVFVYSSDTEYCPEVIELAQEADVLVHEATGKSVGHTPSILCGKTATEANVRSLYLTHYPPDADPEQLKYEAKKHFAGEVIVATDLMEIQIS